MGTIIFIIVVFFIIALLCGAKPSEALGGILIGIICIALYILPFVLLAWLISLFL